MPESLACGGIQRGICPCRPALGHRLMPKPWTKIRPCCLRRPLAKPAMTIIGPVR